MKKENLKSLSKISPLWYFLNTGLNDGRFNMSCDSYLLNLLASNLIKLPVLRIYGWNEPTVSIGVNQAYENIDCDFINSYCVVKRITGGQAVLHGQAIDELTYSLVLSYEYNVKKLYFEVGQILFFFLHKYFLKGKFGYLDSDYLLDFNCFNSKTSADIVVNDVKVIGSAQCRKKEHVLLHGSIRLDKICSLSGKYVDFEQASRDLKESFKDKLKIDFLDYTLTDSDLKKIKGKQFESIIRK